MTISVTIIYGIMLLMQAHALEIKYPKYLFLMYGSNEPYWSNEVDSDDQFMHSCGLEDIAEALHYSLAALQFRSLSSNELYHLPCYDATWTLALALNATLEGTKFNG